MPEIARKKKRPELQEEFDQVEHAGGARPPASHAHREAAPEQDEEEGEQQAEKEEEE